jgi:hypothetical protein
MGNKLIEQLLERYFAGETSLAEEQQLCAFFQRQEVPESLRPYQPLFRYLAQQQAQARLSSDFDAQLLQRLAPAAPEAKIRRLAPRAWALRIAAAMALALGMAWLMLPQLQPHSQPEVAAIDWAKYEVQDLDEAFAITQSALNRASAELNRGTAITSREMENLGQMGKFFK